MPEALLLEIEARVQEALASSPVYALRGVQVEQMGESLQISGRVTTYYNKQQAQELVRSLAEGLQVINLLTVDLPQPR